MLLLPFYKPIQIITVKWTVDRKEKKSVRLSMNVIGSYNLPGCLIGWGNDKTCIGCLLLWLQCCWDSIHLKVSKFVCNFLLVGNRTVRKLVRLKWRVIESESQRYVNINYFSFYLDVCRLFSTYSEMQDYTFKMGFIFKNVIVYNVALKINSIHCLRVYGKMHTFPHK